MMMRRRRRRRIIKTLLVNNHKQGPGTLLEDGKHVYFFCTHFFKTISVVPGQRVCQSDTSRPLWGVPVVSIISTRIQNFFLEVWRFINLVSVNYCNKFCEDLKLKSCEPLPKNGGWGTVYSYFGMDSCFSGPCKDWGWSFGRFFGRFIKPNSPRFSQKQTGWMSRLGFLSCQVDSWIWPPWTV